MRIYTIFLDASLIKSLQLFSDLLFIIIFIGVHKSCCDVSFVDHNLEYFIVNWETTYVARAPWSLFFEKFKNDIKFQKKNWK
jgi:hypothetical protein